jgi:lipid-binding SYLF domain-containing protein
MTREPDKGIPLDLFDQARCVIIIPAVKKGAFVVGGTIGLATMALTVAASRPKAMAKPTQSQAMRPIAVVGETVA